MAKYDSFLGDLKTQIAAATNIIIFLPTRIYVDKLAAALALKLSLEQAGKNVFAVTQEPLRVSSANLFGVGDVKNEYPKLTGGDLTVSLEGVVDSAGKVPALERLDWYPEGGSLNLVFHVVPGQRFEPSNIATKYAGGALSMVFVVGSAQPNYLGPVYQQNIQNFSGVPVVNIDNTQNNTNFGTVNIIDPSSSLSEMVMHVLGGLGLGIDGDIASNILAGIYDGTRNLTNNISADTFLAIGQAIQLGGKVPQPTGQPSYRQQQGTLPSQQQQVQQTQVTQPVIAEQSAVAAQEPNIAADAAVAIPARAPAAEPSLTNIEGSALSSVEGPDLSKVFQIGQSPPQPQPGNTGEEKKIGGGQQQVPQGQEEIPKGEFAATLSPEASATNRPSPDWLTPKIFKGGQG